jgi:translation initiation factor IF-1
MSGIVEIIRRVVRQELARDRGTLLGVVTAVHPHEAEDDENNYEADLRLKHENLELRRVPIAVGHVGIAAPPRVGDLVLVQFLNGDANQPLVTGRFYHADERPPLHRENEVMFEQRVADDTINHLRFTPNGSILLQRDVTEQAADDAEAKATIKVDGEKGHIEIKLANDHKAGVTVDGENGNVQIKSGDKIFIKLTHDGDIQITADGKPIKVECAEMKVTNGSTSTTIKGNEITGATTP